MSRIRNISFSELTFLYGIFSQYSPCRLGNVENVLWIKNIELVNISLWEAATGRSEKLLFMKIKNNHATLKIGINFL